MNGYRIEKLLGEGGFGITYLVRDLLDQVFAMKEHFPHQFATRSGLDVVARSDTDLPVMEECRSRFLKEAQALVRLGRVAGAHDAVVPVRTYFEANHTAYMVMDFVRGESLESALRRQPGGLEADSAATLLSDLLRGLRLVHGTGLMHRDIKPANIIMRPDGRPVLIDFGSTREVSAVASGYTQIFSARYAPVEQILGREQGLYSDIYAVGAVGYRAIGGVLTDALARQAAIAAGQPDPMPPASHVGARRHHPALLAALDAALSVEARDRPPTADAMLRAMRADVPAEDTVILAPVLPPGPAISRVRAVSRRPRATFVFGALALGAIGVSATLFMRTEAPAPSLSEPGASVRETRVEHEAVPSSQPAPPSTAPGAPAAPDDARHASAARTGAVPLDDPASPVPVERSTQPDAEAAALRPAPADRPADAGEREAPAHNPALVPQAPSPAASRSNLEKASSEEPMPSEHVPPIEAARALAATAPCSVLAVSSAGEGLRVSGQALPGSGLESVLRRLADLGVLAGDIAPLESAFCPVVEVLASLVRANRLGARRLVLTQQQAPGSGARRPGLRVESAGNVPLLVDTFSGTGKVRHLLRRPARAGGDRAQPGAERSEWVLGTAQGRHLLIALAGSLPPDLMNRPETEDASAYLEALRRALPRVAEEDRGRLTADLALIDADPGVPTTAPAEAQRGPLRPAAPRPRAAGSARCEAIMERAQLGASLSDVERKTLASGCN